MGFNEYFLLAGAVLAVAFGIFRLPKLPSYVVFLLIAAWPAYTLGAKNGWGFATVAIMTLVVFAIYAGLHWVSRRFSPRKA